VAQVAVCSEINTKHINTVWAEWIILSVKNLLVHEISRLWKVKLRGTVIVASPDSKFTTITQSEGLHCTYKSRRFVPILKPMNPRQTIVFKCIKIIFYTVLPYKIFTLCFPCRFYIKNVWILRMSIRAIRPSDIILNPTIIPIYWEIPVFVCGRFSNGC
jgi:hypothetical protein